MSRLSSSLLLLFLLTACTSRFPAPVADLDETPRFVDSGRTHRVNDGETLFVVAWIYELDVGALARANNLREPYAITPGQILSVDLRGSPARPGTGTVGTATTTPVTVATGIRRTPLESTPLARQPLPTTELPPQATTPPATTTPPTNTTPAPLPQTTTAPAVIVPSTPPPSVPAADPDAPIRWDWPTRGNIIGRFSDSDADNKGIKLSGSEGDTVMAAADGEVVYTGNGLLRYGELVILKHNERFLSAYAHNKVITVKEGDRVTRGQKIAELGSTGIDRDMLHFEIRLDGKPVDPIAYLPAR